MSDWFSGGFDKAREVKEQQDKGEFEFANEDKCRFWVSPKQERNIIFLDDFDWKFSTDGFEQLLVPFCRNEYKVDLNNGPESWRNCTYITCTKGISPCKPAEMNFRSQYVGAMTILDVTPFKDKQTGEILVRPRKRLMMATATAMVIIETKKTKKGNLKGWKYSVTRHEKTDPRVGSDFEPEEQIEDVRAYLNSLKCPEINLDPYGLSAEEASAFYRKLFEPMPYDLQESLFNGNVKDANIYNAGKVPIPAAESASGNEAAPIKY